MLPDDKDTVLILAGDLWIGTKWIEWAGLSWISKVAPRFKEVLVVLGNHDYWPQGNITIKNGGDKCNALLQDMGLDNVRVLDMNTHQIENVLFVGATLWTDMNQANPFIMHQMNEVMAYDGKVAFETGEGGQWSRFTSQKWIYTHYRHREYIRQVAKQNPDNDIVVITHHTPLHQVLHPYYRQQNQFTNFYYSSDLSELILDHPNIKHWLFGHTHYQQEWQLEHCRLTNNAVGYTREMMEQHKLVKHEVIEVGTLAKTGLI